MRTVEVKSPSFPEVPPDKALPPFTPGELWRVVCGDHEHWRCGYYAPNATCREEIQELEQHTCPELFLLIRGRVNLVLGDVVPPRVVELEPLRPILVSAPHTGFCPDGPHTGICLVIERDTFKTTYAAIEGG